jgi:hypothetical protein
MMSMVCCLGAFVIYVFESKKILKTSVSVRTRPQSRPLSRNTASLPQLLRHWSAHKRTDDRVRGSAAHIANEANDRAYGLGGGSGVIPARSSPMVFSIAVI